MLDGTGPVISASTKAYRIVFADYVPNNLESLSNRAPLPLCIRLVCIHQVCCPSSREKA